MRHVFTRQQTELTKVLFLPLRYTRFNPGESSNSKDPLHLLDEGLSGGDRGNFSFMGEFLKRVSSVLLVFFAKCTFANTTAHSVASNSQAPEPSTLLLMSLPLLAFGALAFRRSRHTTAKDSEPGK
jgi:hypothetical protein